MFEGLPEQSVAKAEAGSGKPRMREPERRQIELRPVDLDSLLAADHPARVIWRYVERLDLKVLEDAIGAREHTPGQGSGEPTSSAGAVALCDQPGRGQRAGAGATVREPRWVSVAVRRGERELSRPGRLPQWSWRTAGPASDTQHRGARDGRSDRACRGGAGRGSSAGRCGSVFVPPPAKPAQAPEEGAPAGRVPEAGDRRRPRRQQPAHQGGPGAGRAGART